MVNLRPLVAFLVAGLALVPVAAALQDGSGCNSLIDRQEPTGDVSLGGARNTNYNAPEADITHVRMELANDTLTYSLTLAKSPVGDTDSYRYWLGFRISVDGAAAAHMDVRIAATTKYDVAPLVSTDATGDKDIETVPLVWNGPSVSVHIPMKDLRAFYGGNVTVGQPEASSDGIFKETLAQGPEFGLPYVEDFTSQERWQPLSECPVASATAAPMPTIEKRAPTPAALSIAACVVLAAILVRRAHK